jgi:hypothetical protein
MRRCRIGSSSFLGVASNAWTTLRILLYATMARDAIDIKKASVPQLGRKIGAAAGIGRHARRRVTGKEEVGCPWMRDSAPVRPGVA